MDSGSGVVIGLTTFGTPRDITVEELRIELFYPADEPTEARLRSFG